jgi:hypothetical protein
MATHILTNWSTDSQEELVETDLVAAFIHGVEVGRQGHTVSVYKVDVSPIEELYRTPVPEASSPRQRASAST